jgi:iduronate 2-sulfatase
MARRQVRRRDFLRWAAAGGALGLHKPHDPFIAPKKYFDLYPPDSIQLPQEPAGRTPDLPLTIGSGWKAAFDKFTDRERREFKRAYYAGSSFMDAQLGKVLGALDRLQLWDRTIVVKELSMLLKEKA